MVVLDRLSLSAVRTAAAPSSGYYKPSGQRRGTPSGYSVARRCRRIVRLMWELRPIAR
jgi:hypothetical protein